MIEPRRRFALAAAFATVAALALGGCDEAKPSAPSSDLPHPVLVTRAHYEDQHPARTFVGTVKPRFESDLGFRVTGKAARRLVEVGDIVKTGDPLAILDDTDLKLQRDQAEAELQAATTALAQAEADLRRDSALRGQGWTTAQALEKQNVAVEEARARRDKAERALALAVNALSYATLKADSDGVVTATSVEPGQVMAAGQTAIVLARTAEKEAAVAIPEQLIEQVKAGVATVSLWSNPDKVYQARLRELSPSADPATRTYAARFTILAADSHVDLGMTATLTIADEQSARIARLPLSALFDQGRGPCIFVVDEASGSVRRQPVEVAAYEANAVVLKGGVPEGAEVVTLGVHKLGDGQKVRIVDALGS